MKYPYDTFFSDKNPSLLDKSASLINKSASLKNKSASLKNKSRHGYYKGIGSCARTLLLFLEINGS